MAKKSRGTAEPRRTTKGHSRPQSQTQTPDQVDNTTKTQPTAPAIEHYFFRQDPNSKDIWELLVKFVNSDGSLHSQSRFVECFKYKDLALDAVKQLYESGKIDSHYARVLRNQIYDSNLSDAKSATLKAVKCACSKNHLLLFVNDELQADVDSLSKGVKEYITITRSTQWRFSDSNIEEFRIAIMTSGLPHQTPMEIALEQRIIVLFLDQNDGSPIPIMMVLVHGMEITYTAFSKPGAYQLSCELFANNEIESTRWQTMNKQIAESKLSDELSCYDILAQFVAGFISDTNRLLEKIYSK